MLEYLAEDIMIKSIAKILLRFLVSLFALVLLVVLFGIIEPFFNYNRPVSKAKYPFSNNWMKDVDGTLLLNQIIIPGTHDSGTSRVQLAFFSKCQQKNIYGQLNDGYRYLDIRLGAEGNRLKLMHGFTNCKSSKGTLYLEEVISQCQQFLEENPSETIIFVVKQEHGNESVAQFQTLLNSYIQQNSELWYTENTIPCLEDARGKIVLMRRFGDEAGLEDKSGIEFKWIDQRGSENVKKHSEVFYTGKISSIKLIVQDRFEYNTMDKWNAFVAANTGVRRMGKNEVLLNFLSTKGTWVYGHPYWHAKKLNRMLNDHLDVFDVKGWIIVDFGSAELAEKIYRLN